METMPLKLQDLVPKEAHFELEDYPGKKFTLCRWSLRVRAWVLERYTSKELENIFKHHQINDIAVISYFMLKEKEQFPTLDSFLDSVVSIQDQINLIKALLTSVGIGEPEMKKIDESLKASGDSQAPNEASP